MIMSSEDIHYDSIPLSSINNFEDRIVLLNAFHKRCKNKDTNVVFAYPIVPVQMMRMNSEVTRQMHAAMKAKLTIRILNNPKEAVFSKENFYDSQHHMTKEGKQERTRLLLDALKKWIESNTNFL
jgi:hypothetical protein